MTDRWKTFRCPYRQTKEMRQPWEKAFGRHLLERGKNNQSTVVPNRWMVRGQEMSEDMSKTLSGRLNDHRQKSPAHSTTLYSFESPSTSLTTISCHQSGAEAGNFNKFKNRLKPVFYFVTLGYWVWICKTQYLIIVSKCTVCESQNW